jgi:hypothetical protein
MGAEGEQWGMTLLFQLLGFPHDFSFPWGWKKTIAN